jgi:hypothetical protein
LTRLLLLPKNSKKRITGQKRMNSLSNIALRSFLPVAIALTLSGCGTTKPKPVAWNLSIKKATHSSFKVDVVGVSPSLKATWENAKVSNYWQDNSPLRGSASHIEAKFSGDPPAWRLERTDPIWSQWINQGATYLMIITSLPGNNFVEGPFDRRRLIVPLDKNAWEAKKNTLEFEIRDEMIVPLTRQLQAN